jgi:hypothetical protein
MASNWPNSLPLPSGGTPHRVCRIEDDEDGGRANIPRKYRASLLCKARARVAYLDQTLLPF